MQIPDQVYAGLHAAAVALTGARLFTVTVQDVAAGVVRRAYTSHPVDYPTSGTKPLQNNPWSQQVLVQGKSFVANTTAEFRDLFPRPPVDQSPWLPVSDEYSGDRGWRGVWHRQSARRRKPHYPDRCRSVELADPELADTACKRDAGNPDARLKHRPFPAAPVSRRNAVPTPGCAPARLSSDVYRSGPFRPDRSGARQPHSRDSTHYRNCGGRDPVGKARYCLA